MWNSSAVNLHHVDFKKGTWCFGFRRLFWYDCVRWRASSFEHSKRPTWEGCLLDVTGWRRPFHKKIRLEEYLDCAKNHYLFVFLGKSSKFFYHFSHKNNIHFVRKVCCFYSVGQELPGGGYSIGEVQRHLQWGTTCRIKGAEKRCSQNTSEKSETDGNLRARAGQNAAITECSFVFVKTQETFRSPATS